MTNETIGNLIKAVGIAALITCGIATLYGLGGLGVSILSVESDGIDLWQVLGSAASGFVGSFVFIFPVVWLITFALLQRRLTNNPPVPRS
jgi:hypothetical protein